MINSKDAFASNTPKARSENLIVQNTEKELLVYDLNTNKAICLNETSAMVWKHCDGTKTVKEITRSLSDTLNNEVKSDVVWLALDQLEKENLLDDTNPESVKFAGLSRREVIRKVGVGSMVALPIISSIVSPAAIHAATCVGMGANFPQGQQTAAGTTPNCPTSNICDGQGANCCTGMATIMCLGPAGPGEPFTCNCT